MSSNREVIHSFSENGDEYVDPLNPVDEFCEVDGDDFPRAVRFGTVTTRLVNNDQLSPFEHVLLYSPVRYVTRRQQRLMSAMRQYLDNLSSVDTPSYWPRTRKDFVNTSTEPITAVNEVSSCDALECRPEFTSEVSNALSHLRDGTLLWVYIHDKGPQERWVTLQSATEEPSIYTTFLVIYGKQSTSEVIPTSSITGVVTDWYAVRNNVSEFMDSSGRLRGPILRGRRLQAPSNFAFTICLSSASMPSLTMVALDVQAFICWKIAVTYITKVNEFALNGSATV